MMVLTRKKDESIVIGNNPVGIFGIDNMYEEQVSARTVELISGIPV